MSRLRHTNSRFKRKNFLIFGSIIIVFLLLASAFVYNKWRAVSYDIAIINAVIHDGTKNGKEYTGGLGIKGNRIVEIWKGRTWLIKPRANLLINAHGADLSSGFIDTHSHADLSVSGNGSGKVRADNFVGQGVTTMIVGNCGRSHTDVPAFVRSFDYRRSNINIATLIGLNSVRKKIMNESSAPASASEIARMRELVKEGMQAGAFGVSTGFAYPPGIFASKTEVIEQLKVAKGFGGIHATHMRSEGKEITKAVEEVINLSRSAGIPLLISHYKITGLTNCRMFDELHNMLAKARSTGMQLYVDQYPYDASSTNLNLFLPDWYLAMDRKGKASLTSKSNGREKLKEGIKHMLYQEGFHDLCFAAISYYSPHREWQGKSIDEVDHLYLKTPKSTLDTQLDIFVEMERHGGAQMVYHNICPDVIDRIIQEEDNMVGTDSAIRYEDTESIPHPRGWGTFPRFLKYTTREKKLLSIDQAIYRITGLPAKVFGLKQRGNVKKGYYADIVVFDSKNINDEATYDDPFAPPSGIKCVIVNGKAVINNDENVKANKKMILDVYPGTFIKHNY